MAFIAKKKYCVRKGSARVATMAESENLPSLKAAADATGGSRKPV